MLKFLDYTLQGLGFDNIADFGQSLIHSQFGLLAILKVSVILGTVASLIESFVGLTPMAYVAFLLLVILEFVTGIRASLKNGVKLESRKFGRMIIKIALYTIIIGILHVFKTELLIPTILGITINIYEWLYYVILNMVLVQLIISVIENLSRMGMMEANKILVVIKNKFSKWFDLDTQRD